MIVTRGLLNLPRIVEIYHILVCESVSQRSGTLKFFKVTQCLIQKSSIYYEKEVIL